MIELSHIYKNYGELCVLHDITLRIEDGEIMAIVGPSGAGKTSLVQVAGTLEGADGGEVRYDGRELTRLRDKQLSAFRNGHIGFVFQFHQLLPEFTALENVMLPALIGGKSRRDAESRAAELLEMLGIADRATHKPAQLSGGERQRVAIARALVNSPGVVFADEPTGSLDTANRDEILSLIADLNRRLKQTFVIVTHDPAVAAIADRVVSMADGKITGIALRESAGEGDSTVAPCEP